MYKLTRLNPHNLRPLDRWSSTVVTISLPICRRCRFGRLSTSAVAITDDVSLPAERSDRPTPRYYQTLAELASRLESRELSWMVGCLSRRRVALCQRDHHLKLEVLFFCAAPDLLHELQQLTLRGRSTLVGFFLPFLLLGR